MKGNIRKLIGLLSILTLVLAGMVVAIPAAAHAPGVVLNCGLGTPKINGVISPGEWDTAGYINFLVNTPYGGTTPGTVFAMNDQYNLYLAIRFVRDHHLDILGNTAAFEFDNDNSGGARVNGDDVILFNPNPAVGFSDNFRDPVAGPIDKAYGGTNDGAGAFSDNGKFIVYEFSHPLDSADDAHDFSLEPGDTVGFSLFIRMIAGAYPDGYGDTDFPAPYYDGPDFFGDIVTAVPADNGSQPNDSSYWGQAHKGYNQAYGPGAIGDVFSNDHQGWKGIDPPPYPGGIEDYWIGD